MFKAPETWVSLIFTSDVDLRCYVCNLGIRVCFNYAFWEFSSHAEEEFIKYWRTRNQQEVDFVVQRDDGTAAAYEVKWQGKAFRESKYAFFRKKYPEIPLECISLKNAFESDFSKST